VKLTRIDLYQIVIPRPRFVTSFTTYTESRNAFVRAWTDTGLSGVGETVAVPSYLGETYESMQGAFKILAPVLLGQDPWHIGPIHERMDDLIIGHHPTKAAIDTALYDIMGKAAGVPIHALLGGARRDAVATHLAIPIMEPEEMAARAAELVKQGFRAFEVKVGLEPRRDVERIRRVREAAGPEPLLVVDTNANWTFLEAVVCLRAMEPYGIWSEQPVEHVDDLAKIRTMVKCPIIADESAKTVKDVIQVIAKSAADVISIKLQKAGGIYPARQIMSICDGAGLPYRIDDMGVTRIGNSASAHLAYAAKHLVAAGVAQHKNLDERVDPIKTGGVRVAGGIARLADGPGLGLEVDEAFFKEPVLTYSA
jgi:L-alanine-DL-glutamate epimerase-like enolase superfamily enzyme